MFRALVSNGGATLQISFEHHGWGHESVRSSPVMKTALSSFLTAHSLKGDASNAPAFFGISCQDGILLLSTTSVPHQQPLTFILTADEMIIDAEGVVFTEESLRLDIAASAPRRALRPRAARAVASASLMCLASSESVIGQIEAHLKGSPQ